MELPEWVKFLSVLFVLFVFAWEEHLVILSKHTCIFQILRSVFLFDPAYVDFLFLFPSGISPPPILILQLCQ